MEIIYRRRRRSLEFSSPCPPGYEWPACSEINAYSVRRWPSLDWHLSVILVEAWSAIVERRRYVSAAPHVVPNGECAVVPDRPRFAKSWCSPSSLRKNDGSRGEHCTSEQDSPGQGVMHAPPRRAVFQASRPALVCESGECLDARLVNLIEPLALKRRVQIKAGPVDVPATISEVGSCPLGLRRQFVRSQNGVLDLFGNPRARKQVE